MCCRYNAYINVETTRTAGCGSRTFTFNARRTISRRFVPTSARVIQGFGGFAADAIGVRRIRIGCAINFDRIDWKHAIRAAVGIDLFNRRVLPDSSLDRRSPYVERYRPCEDLHSRAGAVVPEAAANPGQSIDPSWCTATRQRNAGNISAAFLITARADVFGLTKCLSVLARQAVLGEIGRYRGRRCVVTVGRLKHLVAPLVSAAIPSRYG